MTRVKPILIIVEGGVKYSQFLDWDQVSYVSMRENQTGQENLAAFICKYAEGLMAAQDSQMFIYTDLIQLEKLPIKNKIIIIITTAEV